MRVGALLLLLVLACNCNHLANIKLFHGIPDVTVDVYANGGIFAEKVAYGTFTGYFPVTEGDLMITITRTGVSPATETLVSQIVSLEGSEWYSIVAAGTVDSSAYPPQIILLDDSVDILGERAILRTVHLSPTTINFDIKNGPDVLWSDISYSNTGDPEYLTLSAGFPYQIGVTLVGSSNIIAGPTLLSLARNSAGTVYIIGDIGSDSSPLNVIYVRDFVTGQVSITATPSRTATVTRTATPSSSRTMTPTPTRSFNTSATATPSRTPTPSLTPVTTRSRFRTVPADDDDGDFTRSSTPVVIPTRTRVIASSVDVIFSSSPSSAAFPSPFLSRTPFRTVFLESPDTPLQTSDFSSYDVSSGDFSNISPPSSSAAKTAIATCLLVLLFI